MLDNTFYKLTHDKHLSVGYFGGSITEGAGASDASRTSWRARVTEWFRTSYPDAEVAEIYAAIGGTGSDLGMYRCDTDLLAKNPDLVFIEFAVNDSWMNYDAILMQTETIYRKIRRKNPCTDIVCIITTTASIASGLEKGGEFTARSAHSVIAHRYSTPIIDVGNILHFEVLKNGGDFLKYTTDTVHPNDEGYDLYTECIAAYLKKWAQHSSANALTPYTMPVPVCDKVYENRACMIDCMSADSFESDGFALVETSLCGRYPRYIEAVTPGSSFSFDFTGETCGFYWMMAKDSGDILVSVDGGEEKTLSSWDHYCKSFNRANLAFAAKGLPDGKHHVNVRVADTKADESEGTAIRIGALLIS